MIQHLSQAKFALDGTLEDTRVKLKLVHKWEHRPKQWAERSPVLRWTISASLHFDAATTTHNNEQLSNGGVGLTFPSSANSALFTSRIQFLSARMSTWTISKTVIYNWLHLGAGPFTKSHSWPSVMSTFHLTGDLVSFQFLESLLFYLFYFVHPISMYTSLQLVDIYSHLLQTPPHTHNFIQTFFQFLTDTFHYPIYTCTCTPSTPMLTQFHSNPWSSNTLSASLSSTSVDHSTIQKWRQSRWRRLQFQMFL